MGLHGVGKVNEAGQELLSFCALNRLAVMNTYFEIKSIYKHTWQHPGSKKWHCIDYVTMRQKQGGCPLMSVLCTLLSVGLTTSYSGPSFGCMYHQKAEEVRSSHFVKSLFLVIGTSMASLHSLGTSLPSRQC